MKIAQNMHKRTWIFVALIMFLVSCSPQKKLHDRISLLTSDNLPEKFSVIVQKPNVGNFGLLRHNLGITSISTRNPMCAQIWRSLTASALPDTTTISVIQPLVRKTLESPINREFYFEYYGSDTPFLDHRRVVERCNNQMFSSRDKDSVQNFTMVVQTRNGPKIKNLVASEVVLKLIPASSPSTIVGPSIYSLGYIQIAAHVSGGFLVVTGRTNYLQDADMQRINGRAEMIFSLAAKKLLLA